MSFRNKIVSMSIQKIIVLNNTLYPSSHSLMPLSTWLIKCNNFKMHNLVSLRGSKIYNNLFYAIFLMLRFFSTHRSFCSFTFIRDGGSLDVHIYIPCGCNLIIFLKVDIVILYYFTCTKPWLSLFAIHIKMKAAINSVVSYYPTINFHCKCFDNWIFLLICPTWLILPEQKNFFLLQLFFVLILSFSFWFYLMELRREKNFFCCFNLLAPLILDAGISCLLYWKCNRHVRLFFLCSVLFSFTYLVELCLKLSFLFLVTMKCGCELKGLEIFQNFGGAVWKVVT